MWQVSIELLNGCVTQLLMKSCWSDEPTIMTAPGPLLTKSRQWTDGGL